MVVKYVYYDCNKVLYLVDFWIKIIYVLLIKKLRIEKMCICLFFKKIYLIWYKNCFMFFFDLMVILDIGVMGCVKMVLWYVCVCFRLLDISKFVILLRMI